MEPSLLGDPDDGQSRISSLLILGITGHKNKRFEHKTTSLCPTFPRGVLWFRGMFTRTWSEIYSSAGRLEFLRNPGHMHIEASEIIAA